MIRRIVLAVLLAGAAPMPAFGQADLAVETAKLEDLRSIREIKNLQASWGHYAFHGAWQAMASLTTPDVKIITRYGEINGQGGVESWLRTTQGNGERQMVFSPGKLNARLFLSPVITLAPDGQSATARWHEVAMTAGHGEEAAWQGFTHIVQYRRAGGIWQISQIRPYEHFSGSYDDGWMHDAATLERAPYHYTPDEAGQLLTGRRADAAMGEDALAVASTKLLNLSLAQNTVNAFGYYLDRGMYDDVVDLFAEDATVDVAGQGQWTGHDGVRRFLARFGAPGLDHGELNDRPQLMPKVMLLPDGQIEVTVIELGMTGQHGGKGEWSIATQSFRLALGDDGKWRIASMIRAPWMRADYEAGWDDPLPAALPVPANGRPDGETRIRARTYPQFAYGVPLSPPLLEMRANGGASIEPVANALAKAEAFDGAANVSNANGYYIDQFDWPATAALFSTDGWKELSYIGTYVGRDRVLGSLIQRYGMGGPNDAFQAIHQKTQPYVTFQNEDGTRAFVRNRLLQFNSSDAGPGSWISGIYENQIIKEDGIWRIQGMDLDYVWLGDYEGGWMGIVPGASARFGPAPEVLEEFTPDAPLRGEVFAPFPEIRPMGFHFANPVSGRAPEVLLEWSDGFRFPTAE